MLLCILLHSRLNHRTFWMKQDSRGNTTLSRDFSHPVFLVFLDSMDRLNGTDRSSTRPCFNKEVDYVVELYSIKHQLCEELWVSILQLVTKVSPFVTWECIRTTHVLVVSCLKLRLPVVCNIKQLLSLCLELINEFNL